MKKLLSVLLILCVLIVSPAGVEALTEGDWTYKILENEIIITGYTGNEKSVSVPSQIHGCPVVKIDTTGEDRYRLMQIEKITLPDTIKEIGEEVFYNSKLKNINFPQNLEKIGFSSFRNCDLIQVNLSQCKNLKTIGDCAFFECRSLNMVILPDHINEISGLCFSGCTALKNIVIPSSVAYIKGGAFSNCDITGTLIIPPTVQEIHSSAFSGNNNLEEVIISYGTSFVSGFDAVDGSISNKYSNGAFEKCESLRAIYIPDTVVNISRNINRGSKNSIIYCSEKAPFITTLKENEISYLIDNSVNTTINILYNDSRISFHSYGQNPMAINGRTMVPLRSIFEVMGAKVDWDNNTQTATATRGNTTIEVSIGKNCICKNGTAIPTDVPAEIINGRTMIPVRVIVEAFEAKVEWDGMSKTVIINE